MQSALTHLERKLGSDPSYFRTVYNYTFHFARSDGQRSLGTALVPALSFPHTSTAKDTALEYWRSLLHFGVGTDALKYTPDADDDVDMERHSGWTRKHTEWWLEYMEARDDVAVSKDTWQMVCIRPLSCPLLTPVQLPDFIRSFDGDLNKHDDQGNPTAHA